MKSLRTAFLGPAVLVFAVLFAGPLLITAAYSLLSRGTYGGVTGPPSIEALTRLVDPIYAVILWRSVWMAALSTLLCLVLGFPLALFISRARRHRSLYLALVILPFWTSLLIRLYAWMFLLRDTGLINTALLSVGLIHEPLPLLYNDAAVILGLVYGYLPFTVLPLYSTLERLDPALLEAAADLGARPLTALLRITLPMCAPGFRAAALLVFIPCLGAYLTPDLLGGGKSIMIGNVVQNQFTSARDWPFGSALSMALMAIVLALLLTMVRKDEETLL